MMTSTAHPNVILICVDEWRGDCLSSAGHPRVRTPHIDAIADAGTRFERAYSAVPTCVPARVGLLTGQSQERHGRVGYQECVPFTERHGDTIATVFGRAGYQTQAIGKMHVFPERSRVGFDNVILHDGFLHVTRATMGTHFARYDDYVSWLRDQPGVASSEEYFDHGAGCNSTVARPWDKAERLHPTAWVGQQALDWLDRRDPTCPFFLFLSFHRPHPPYDPPQWALDMYLDLPAEERVLGDWLQELEEFRTDGRHDLVFGQLDDHTWRRAKAAYYALMSHIDLQISRLLEALAAHGVAEDTIVAFTSDHGEMLGDHDFYRKAVPYEGSARVPLVIAPDATARRSAARRCSAALVELRDIMPTLLDLAGVEVPDSCDGLSLAAIVRGQDQGPVRSWLHGEHVYLRQSIQWVTNQRFKYVWFSGSGLEQLFDLASDPQELHNLRIDPDHADVLRECRAALIDVLRDREEGFVAGGELVTGRPVTSTLNHPPHAWAGPE